MANLPTAYASQRFGRKTLEYYAVEGDAVGADPRARSEERRLEDMDGQRHTVRLMEKGFALEPGQTATVLRMQPGPGRRSRPVALVNHDTSSWCRTHPGADGLLAKAGVARTFNWALTMALFALAALTLVWPFLRAFLVEVDPGLFGATPDLNVAALAIAALPALSSWSFSDAIAPLTGPLGSAAPALAPLADMLVFGTGVIVAALGVYILRSWRLLWAPLFVGVLGAVSIAYGGPAGMVEPALSGLGLAALLFLTGGVINRIRDGARLEARIAVLADHLLRQGPQDAVVAPETEAEPEIEPEAEVAANDDLAGVVPLTAATAASLRAMGDTDGAEEVDAGAGPAPIEAEEIEVQAQDAPPVEAESADAVEAIEAEAADVSEEDDAIEAQADAEATTTEVIAPPEPELEASDDVAPVDALETTSDVDANVDDTGVDSVAAEPDGELESDAPVTEPEPVAVSGDEPAEQEVEASEALAAEPQLEADPTDTTPAGLDPEEAERLRSDPRYASRAIVLPPPPPMPGPGSDLGEGSGEAIGQGELTTLKPSAPLPDNVIPIFAAPASSELPASADADPDAPDGEEPRDPA